MYDLRHCLVFLGAERIGRSHVRGGYPVLVFWGLDAGDYESIPHIEGLKLLCTCRVLWIALVLFLGTMASHLATVYAQY